MSKPSHYKVGCDAHKHYSLFAVLDHRGRPVEQARVDHEPGAIRAFLSRFPESTPVALETVGNWYCLHCAAGTRGSSMRSNKLAASLY
jgi:hypothetical protein